MRYKQSYRLLSKTTFIYLIFAFIAFFASAVFLTREVDQFIRQDMEKRFARLEYRLVHHLKSGRPLEQLHPNARAKLLLEPPPSGIYPVYSDTMIYNAENDEMQLFRKKKLVLPVEGRYYQATLWKSMDDFARLRDDTFEALVPAFIALAIAIVLFNGLLSGYFFRPFNAILNLMKTYQVGQRQEIQKISTSTTEFKKMQDLYHQMIDRIEQDYRHLKEYTENMAHEMQTPLTIIRNKTENLIGDVKVMKHQAETVKTIYQESNHLSKLGTTLNLITRIENNEFNNVIQLKTQSIIEGHVAAIHELADLKSMTIECSLAESHELRMDPFLFDIVLKNLLNNAVTYGTTDGPVRIWTTTRSFSISNYGPPLNFSTDRLFERFNRSRPTRASLGLGLAIVKKICELNGLQIDYQYQDQQHIFSVKEVY